MNIYFNGLLHLQFSKFLKLKIVFKNEKGIRMYPYVTRMLLVYIPMLLQERMS